MVYQSQPASVSCLWCGAAGTWWQICFWSFTAGKFTSAFWENLLIQLSLFEFCSTSLEMLKSVDLSGEQLRGTRWLLVTHLRFRSGFTEGRVQTWVHVWQRWRSSVLWSEWSFYHTNAAFNKNAYLKGFVFSASDEFMAVFFLSQRAVNHVTAWL